MAAVAVRALAPTLRLLRRPLAAVLKEVQLLEAAPAQRLQHSSPETALMVTRYPYQRDLGCLGFRPAVQALARVAATTTVVLAEAAALKTWLAGRQLPTLSSQAKSACRPAAPSGKRGHGRKNAVGVGDR